MSRCAPPCHVVHHVTRRHRAGLEVWPPRATVAFRDEHGANPANTVQRLEAFVVNARSSAVRWEVHAPGGGAGVGAIDATGLYRAPDWAPGLSGRTDVVAATLVEDPLRTAYAWIALVGDGPAPALMPRILVRPKHAYLYHPAGADNSFIDASNTMQIFRASVHDAPAGPIAWRVDGALRPETGDQLLFRLTGSGGVGGHEVRAEVPGASDTARVTTINYDWPGAP